MSDIARDHERSRFVVIEDPETLVRRCLPHLIAAVRAPGRASSHEQHVREICRDVTHGAEGEVAADLLITLESLLVPPIGHLDTPPLVPR